MLSAWEITFSSKHLTRVVKTIIPWNSKDNWYTLGGMGWSSIHEPLSELCMGQNRSFMRLEYNLPHTKGWCLQSLIHCCITCFKNHLRNYSHTKYYLEILAFDSRGNISVEEKKIEICSFSKMKSIFQVCIETEKQQLKCLWEAPRMNILEIFLSGY